MGTSVSPCLKAATANELDAKQLSALAGTRRNIPSHNPAATNPFDAFPFELFPLHALLDRTPWKDLQKASKKPTFAKELEAKVRRCRSTLSIPC
jgi:hypothetical protein